MNQQWYCKAATKSMPYKRILFCGGIAGWICGILMVLMELHARTDCWIYQALSILDWVPAALIRWFSFPPSAARSYYEVIVFIGYWIVLGVLSGWAYCLIRPRRHIARGNR